MVALAWPSHIHHAAALRWFETHHQRGWATCPLTESGFVRVSSNPKVTSEAQTPAEAISLLRQLTGLAGHEFWDDKISIARSDDVDSARVVGYRQVTDAHLLALARDHAGVLVTFDASLPAVCSREVAAEHITVLAVELSS